jgi:hypothetical protein
MIRGRFVGGHSAAARYTASFAGWRRERTSGDNIIFSIRSQLMDSAAAAKNKNSGTRPLPNRTGGRSLCHGWAVELFRSL